MARLLSCTSVRLHRGSLAKVKDKEKTKLMRKLTKTNCPEALDDILVPVVDDKDSDDDIYICM